MQNSIAKNTIESTTYINFELNETDYANEILTIFNNFNLNDDKEKLILDFPNDNNYETIISFIDRIISRYTTIYIAEETFPWQQYDNIVLVILKIPPNFRQYASYISLIQYKSKENCESEPMMVGIMNYGHPGWSSVFNTYYKFFSELKFHTINIFNANKNNEFESKINFDEPKKEDFHTIAESYSSSSIFYKKIECSNFLNKYNCYFLPISSCPIPKVLKSSKFLNFENNEVVRFSSPLYIYSNSTTIVLNVEEARAYGSSMLENNSGLKSSLYQLSNQEIRQSIIPFGGIRILESVKTNDVLDPELIENELLVRHESQHSEMTRSFFYKYFATRPNYRMRSHISLFMNRFALESGFNITRTFLPFYSMAYTYYKSYNYKNYINHHTQFIHNFNKRIIENSNPFETLTPITNFKDEIFFNNDKNINSQKIGLNRGEYSYQNYLDLNKGTRCVAVHLRRGDRTLRTNTKESVCNSTKGFDFGCETIMYQDINLFHLMKVIKYKFKTDIRDVLILTDDSLGVTDYANTIKEYTKNWNFHIIPSTDDENISVGNLKKKYENVPPINDFQQFSTISSGKYDENFHKYLRFNGGGTVPFFASFELAKQCEYFIGHFGPESTSTIYSYICLANGGVCPPYFNFKVLKSLDEVDSLHPGYENI